MKQPVPIKQNSSSEEVHSSRKEQLDKKRMIRKNKTQPIKADLVDLKSIDTSTLTREEKARIQKAKNREAAQKSRDMHKEYVTNLEREIEQLKQYVNSSRKICLKCQRELEEVSNHESNSSDQPTEERSKSQKNFYLEIEDEMPRKDLSSIDPFQHFDQSYLSRVSDFGDQMSYSKSVLFGCLLIVAVLVVGSYTQPQAILSSRALMEVPEPKVEPVDIKQTVNKTDSTRTAVAPLEKGLIALNSDDCLKSLMTVQSLGENKRSLRTYHENVASQTYLTSNQGILLCTVRTPKPYKSRFDKLRSPLVKLYMLGSQIKQMLTHSSLLLPIRDSSIQINGLYRVAAQIKDVNLVNDHNCLL